MVLLDTGSERSLINFEIASGFENSNNGILKKCEGENSRLIVANGSSLNCVGLVTLPLFLGDNKIDVKFLVVENLSTDIILGWDFMTDYEIFIVPPKHIIFKDFNYTVPFEKKAISSSNEYESVLLFDGVESDIQPFSQKFCSVKLPSFDIFRKYPKFGTVHNLQPLEGYPKSIDVCTYSVFIESGMTEISIFNNSENCITLSKEVPLALFKSNFCDPLCDSNINRVTFKKILTPAMLELSHFYRKFPLVLNLKINFYTIINGRLQIVIFFRPWTTPRL